MKQSHTGFTLLYWLVLCPDRWKLWLSRVAPDLGPGFTLLDLQPHHLQQPLFVRPLLSLYLTWVVLVGAGITAVVPVSGGTFEALLYSLLFGLGLGGAGMLLISTLLGVGAGTAGGLGIGVAFGISFGLALHIVPDLTALGDGLNQVGVTVAIAGNVGSFVDLGPVAGALIALSIGVSGYFAALPLESLKTLPLSRQAGGIVVGMVLSGVLFGGVISVGLLLSQTGGLLAAVCAIMAAATGGAFGFCLRLGTRPPAKAWPLALGVALLEGMVIYTAFALNPGPVLQLLLSGMATAVFYSTFFALAFLLSLNLAGPWPAAVAATLASGGSHTLFIAYHHPDLSPWLVLPPALLSMCLGLAIRWWLPLLLFPFEAMWNAGVLFRARSTPTRSVDLLRYNTAFRNQLQFLPQFGLEDHLLLALQTDEVRTQQALQKLGHGPQHQQAVNASVRRYAERLLGFERVEAIATAHSLLPSHAFEGPANTMFRQFSRISEDVAAAENQAGLFNRRLYYGDLTLRLEEVLRALNHSTNPFCDHFLPVARRWYDAVCSRSQQLDRLMTERHEIANPYIVGVPLNATQKVFVGRDELSSEILRLCRHAHSIPLFLYGRRRMGKTSLLNNLGRLLPSSIIPLFIDLQGPPGQTHGFIEFTETLAHAMTRSALRYRDLELPPFHAGSSSARVAFDAWLERIEALVAPRTFLLTLDEFESLERAFSLGRLDMDDVLGMLRHMIQHRSGFSVLLAGSHAIQELRAWAGYLINVQMLEVSYLEEHEARELLLHPVIDFPLRYTPETLDRIIALTRCHPALLQLLAFHLVQTKNRQPLPGRLLVEPDDVETAIERALKQGSFFFMDLEHQAGPEGVQFLTRLATTPEIHLLEPADIRLIGSLRRSGILTYHGDTHAFEVDLVRRWFLRSEPRLPV